MITLDYQLSPTWAEETVWIDLTQADETSLRYDVLLGDVILVVDSTDFSARWGWVPVVDFLACLRYAVRELDKSYAAETDLDFTENDEKIHFRRDESLVMISASYASGETTLSLDELKAAVDAFVQRVSHELCERYPALRRNQAFDRLLSDPVI